MPKTQDVITHTGDAVRRKPVAGDMRWDGKVWTRWSGRRWAHAAYSLHPHRLEVEAAFSDLDSVDEPEQARALALAVEDQVARNGATVVLDGPTGVVLAYRRRVSHLAHALMTLVTAGLWALVWLAMVMGNREDRVMLEADRWGNVWAKPVAGG